MSKKIYTVSMILVLLIAGGAAAFGISRHVQNAEAFWGDGYVLSYQNGKNGSVVPEPLYFKAGTRYKENYSGNISFKDMYGKKQEVPADSFIHYADDSISTFHKGVIVECNELKKGLLNYYSLGAESVMNRQGDKYLLDNQGTPLEFQDYIWKMQEEKYLVSSPEISLTFPDGTEESLKGYAELAYIDRGIVRISGGETAFQVLASGSRMRLADGTELDLENRSIVQNEEVSLYFSEIRARPERQALRARLEKPERPETPVRKAKRETKATRAMKAETVTAERPEKPEKQERPDLLATEAAAEISPIRSLCWFTC